MLRPRSLAYGLRALHLSHRRPVSPSLPAFNRPTRRILITVLLTSLPAWSLAAEDNVPAISLGEAVRLTLAENPGVKSEGELQKQREGVLQTTRGAFDWVAFGQWSQDASRLPLSVATPLFTTQREQTDVYTLGLGRQFRSGITVQPHVSVFGYQNNLSQPVREYRSNLAVDLTIPLLRNLGRAATAADETSARLGVEGGARQYEHAVAQQIARTASAYWNCLAARRNYAIVSDTETRAAELVRFVNLLVEGGELGVGSLDKARAELLKRTAQRRDAELALFQSRQALGLAIGYKPEQLPDAPYADGDFPVATAAVLKDADRSAYIGIALKRRGDYQAVLQNLHVEEVGLGRARNQLKPRLDFTLTAGYAGLEDRTSDRPALSALSHQLTGGNLTGAFSLEWPVANNAARGEVVRRRARVAAGEYDSQTAASGVAADVLNTLQAVTLSQARYQAAAESTRIYARALKVEKDNVSAGESTLLDLIDLEERYATARTDEIDALRAYAVALVNLRLATGTILESTNDFALFRSTRLLEVPEPAAP